MNDMQHLTFQRRSAIPRHLTVRVELPTASLPRDALRLFHVNAVLKTLNTKARPGQLFRVSLLRRSSFKSQTSTLRFKRLREAFEYQYIFINIIYTVYCIYMYILYLKQLGFICFP